MKSDGVDHIAFKPGIFPKKEFVFGKALPGQEIMIWLCRFWCVTVLKGTTVDSSLPPV
jgi:hypothetical protein